jgi:hypothetical protein
MGLLSHRKRNTLAVLEIYLEIFKLAGVQPQSLRNGRKLQAIRRRLDYLRCCSPRRYKLCLLPYSSRSKDPRRGIRPLPGTTQPSTWTRNPPSGKQPSSAASEYVLLSSDSKLYLKGLKDCIAGTLNWSYKTKLYFGSKENEVRKLVGYQII